MYYSHQKKNLQKLIDNIDKLDVSKSIRPDRILLRVL